MAKEMCVECGENYIHIAKRKLCANCYQKYRKEHGAIIRNNENYKYQCKASEEKVGIANEIEFARVFFDHKNYVHHPGKFNLQNGEGYSPDFYDGDRDVFIEVASTRQAYSLNKHKYALFRERFPKINLEIRATTGELLDETELHWQHQYDRMASLHS